MRVFIYFLTAVCLLFSTTTFAATEGAADIMPVSPYHIGALFCLFVFIASYIAVLVEEKIHLSKSKPVMLGAGLIWLAIALIAPSQGVDHEHLRQAVFHGLTEYSSLLLFLLVAMTYITAMQDRNVFAALRGKLVQSGMNMRQMFWATGFIAFFLSPVADNLTTALVVGAVIMSIGKNDSKFVAISCINAVCAANAGGAFSPFGDITTLMVWQAGKVNFFEFFDLFLPSLVNFLVPALIMSFFVAKTKPDPIEDETRMKPGAVGIIVLGLCTIAAAVTFEQVLGLPPFMGMMMGLALLMMYSYYLHFTDRVKGNAFDVFDLIEHAEWDTLLFFFGVIFSVGGLTYLGYMHIVSTALYDGYGASAANSALGISSAIIDNIPIMFAVLKMDPEMPHFQWLLVTLTTGVGGSLLSVGSAAGVALMGVARGRYTFLSHLKWTPVLLLGYAAAIATHFIVNAHMLEPGFSP